MAGRHEQPLERETGLQAPSGKTRVEFTYRCTARVAVSWSYPLLQVKRRGDSGIIADIRVDEHIERSFQLRVQLQQALAPGSGPSDSAVCAWRRIQILHARVQGLSRQTGGAGHTSDAAPSERAGFGTCPKSPLPLIEVGRNGFPASADGSFSVDAQTLSGIYAADIGNGPDNSREDTLATTG